MAIWQHTFHLLPGDSLQQEGIPVISDDGFLNDDILWEGHSIGAEILPQLSKILPEGKSWSPNLKVFGNLESNCIEVLFEDNQICAFSFRIDFLHFQPTWIEPLLELCAQLKLVVITEENYILPIDYGQILAVIKQSQGYKKYIELSEDGSK